MPDALRRRRAVDHEFRVVDAQDLSAGREPAQFPDGDARSEADLQDAIRWLHIQ